MLLGAGKLEAYKRRFKPGDAHIDGTSASVATAWKLCESAALTSDDRSGSACSALVLVESGVVGRLSTSHDSRTTCRVCFSISSMPASTSRSPPFRGILCFIYLGTYALGVGEECSH